MTAFLHEVLPKRRIRSTLFYSFLIVATLTFSVIATTSESDPKVAFALWYIPAGTVGLFLIFLVALIAAGLLQKIYKKIEFYLASILKKLVAFILCRYAKEIKKTEEKAQSLQAGTANIFKKVFEALHVTGTCVIGLIGFACFAYGAWYIIAGILGLLNFGIKNL
jgi:hypothetical protein